MTDYRSAAELFVTEFLNYAQKDDSLKDYFNVKKNRMERSQDVLDLIKQAESVFPPRVDDGKAATDALTNEQRQAAIAAAPNVTQTSEMFARKVVANGGVRTMLRQLYSGEPGARDAVQAFLEAEDGVTKFDPK